jgi:hypothetical protein
LVDVCAADRPRDLTTAETRYPGVWSPWRCPTSPGSRAQVHNGEHHLQPRRLLAKITTIEQADRIVTKMLKAEDKRHRDAITAHLESVGLSPKPKKRERIDELRRQASDPRHPNHQRALDELHQVVGKTRFASIVTKGR